MSDGATISFWKTVGLLLGAARRRSNGRQKRQQQLLNNRNGGSATDWSYLTVFVGAVVMAVLHGVAAFTVIAAVDSIRAHNVEQQGKIIVSRWFREQVQLIEKTDAADLEDVKAGLEESYTEEAENIIRHDGGDAALVEKRLRTTIAETGSRNLITRDDVQTGLKDMKSAGPAAAMLASIILLWWFAMMVCQGEGLELDLQRRRHPVWEWLLSHPIGAGAVFFAEMLAPLSANPSYWTAPLFVGILYGHSLGAGAGLAAAFIIGIPLALAAACLSKALEIGTILRLPPRSRGAVIGILSWFGYASMLIMFLLLSLIPKVVAAFGSGIDFGAQMPWPWIGLFLGLGQDGGFSFLHGMLACWGFSAVVTIFAVMFSARSVRKGLSGAFASDQLPTRTNGKTKFGREPLFRKEYLWFIRDRSAIVQTILIPLTIAAFQLFNLRMILSHAGDSWNYLSGTAIFFGTYLLWVLGPKSLISEGSALWIALTWPRGLEAMLKAKAWLWSMIASGLVVIVLLTACFLFPHDIWKICLVAIGWFFFARSMAEKSVTLVTVVSETGEAQQIPSGRRWAAQLGMLSFGIGVCTQTWSLALVGIIYSWITAAAMWENLRARLPYLYDPWSEQLPAPPTLMHAMVSITILIECASLVTLFSWFGEDSAAASQAIGYALCAVGVTIGVANFLSRRGVHPSQIWCWACQHDASASVEIWVHRYIAANRREAGWLLCGAVGGVLLGIAAHFYVNAIQLIPSIAETIRISEQQMQSIPGMMTAYAIIAIVFAPFAEEYLFRGLLYKSLDQMWGGWKAVTGAAAFFAIYHPPLSWLPVFLVGAANCILFKSSKKLAPAVLLHMAYNSVIVFLT